MYIKSYEYLKAYISHRWQKYLNDRLFIVLIILDTQMDFLYD